MELFIRCVKACGVASLDERALDSDLGAQLAQKRCAVAALQRAGEKRQLERFAKELGLFEVEQPQRRYARPALRDDVDEAELGEPRQRFAHRRPADSELAGERLFGDRFEWLALEMQDLFAERRVDLPRERVVGMRARRSAALDGALDAGGRGFAHRPVTFRPSMKWRRRRKKSTIEGRLAISAAVSTTFGPVEA